MFRRITALFFSGFMVTGSLLSCAYASTAALNLDQYIQRQWPGKTKQDTYSFIPTQAFQQKISSTSSSSLNQRNDSQQKRQSGANVLTQASELAGFDSKGHENDIHFTQPLLGSTAMTDDRDFMSKRAIFHLKDQASVQKKLSEHINTYLNLSLIEAKLQLQKQFLQSKKALYHQLFEGKTVSPIVRVDQASFQQSENDAQAGYLQSRQKAQSQWQKQKGGSVLPYVVQPSLSFPMPTPNHENTWQTYAVNHNPSLQALHQTMMMLEHSMQNIEEKSSPQLSASLNYGPSGLTPPSVMPSSKSPLTKESTIGMQLSVPLLSKNDQSVLLQSKSRKFSQVNQQFQIETARLNANIDTSFSSVVQDSQQIASLQTSLISSNKSFQNTLESYKNKLSSLQAVIGAQKALFVQKNALLQAEYNYMNAYVSLYLSAGILNEASVKTLSSWLVNVQS